MAKRNSNFYSLILTAVAVIAIAALSELLLVPAQDRKPLSAPRETVTTSVAPLLTESIGDKLKPLKARALAEKTSQLDAPTKDLILRCTRGVASLSRSSNAPDFSSLKEFLQQSLLVRGGRVPTEAVSYRNLHVRTPSGKTLRLRITPKDSAESVSAKPEIHLFSEDAEALPVSEPLPKALAEVDADTAVARFRTLGQVTYDEIASRQIWDEESGAKLVSRNGELTSLEVYFAGGALLCAQSDTQDSSQLSCQCMN